MPHSHISNSPFSVSFAHLLLKYMGLKVPIVVQWVKDLTAVAEITAEAQI